MSDKSNDQESTGESEPQDPQAPVQVSEPMVGDEGDQRDNLDRTYAGWAYLGLVFILFLALALLAYACDDDQNESGSESTSTTAESAEATTPVTLEFAVDNSSVTLRGAVPDEGARDQLIEIAVARYGEGNVIDELTVDSATTLTDGTVSISGTTAAGDPLPQELQDDVVRALGLDPGAMAVTFDEAELTPVSGTATVSAEGVALNATLPDQASVDALTGAAGTVWGAENVDASGLTTDSGYTLEGGQIVVSGTIEAGDGRATSFAEAAAGMGFEVVNEVSVDTGSEALTRLEDRFREELAANPILFELGSAQIKPDSDEVLVSAAEAINATPGVNVEIVGHTDNQGDPAANQVLSEQRANAVLDRLVELGVDGSRLTARGAGADEPVADNDTEEGRAQNRRIDFEFEGAGDNAGQAEGDADS